jgi:hypothetical protein
MKKKCRVLGLDSVVEKEPGPVVEELGLNPHFVDTSVDLGLVSDLDPVLRPGIVSVLVSGLDPDMVSGLVSGLNLGLDPSFVMAFDLKPVSFSGKLGVVSGLNQEPSSRVAGVINGDIAEFAGAFAGGLFDPWLGR